MNNYKTYTLAFIVTGFPPEVSGVSLGNWERIQWLAKQEFYRVVVFAPDWQNVTHSLLGVSDYSEKLIIERYPSKPWFPYKLTHVPKFLSAYKINEKLSQYKPDIIILTDVERVFFFSTWQLPGKYYATQHNIPYIAHYHTDFYNFANAYPTWKWLRNIFIRPIIKQLYRQVDSTICSTQNASQSLKEMKIPNINTISFIGIDVSTYHPSRRNRKWLELWLSDQEQANKVILYLGRLGQEKQVDLLIQAFARLKLRSQDKYSLLIAGDGPYNNVVKLKSLSERVSGIHFTGFLHGETKANVLASCDIFCTPSPYETFGRTVVEAMASGDGVNGYLVPVNDIEGLTNTLQKAVSSDNTKIVQQALKDISQFSVEKGCQRLNYYYEHLLNNNVLQVN
jgi:phosphatidylinositol alpha 1,6-mannosyltransferase